jgi:hypothetical protein
MHACHRVAARLACWPVAAVQMRVCAGGGASPARSVDSLGLTPKRAARARGSGRPNVGNYTESLTFSVTDPRAVEDRVADSVTKRKFVTGSHVPALLYGSVVGWRVHVYAAWVASVACVPCRAFLSRAILSRALLSRALLSRAILSRALLSRALLSRALLSRALLCTPVLCFCLVCLLARALLSHALLFRALGPILCVHGWCLSLWLLRSIMREAMKWKELKIFAEWMATGPGIVRTRVPRSVPLCWGRTRRPCVRYCAAGACVCFCECMCAVVRVCVFDCAAGVCMCEAVSCVLCAFAFAYPRPAAQPGRP